MIYNPNAWDNAEYFEEYNERRCIELSKEIIDRKNELEYDDRMDAILLILDWLGYTWQEYAEERRQNQYYLDMKREQIQNGIKNKNTFS